MNKEITISMTLEEWEEIYYEAFGHLMYWNAESEAVDKLGRIIEENKM